MIKKYNVTVVQTNVWTRTVEVSSEHIARMYGLEQAEYDPNLRGEFHILVEEVSKIKS